MSGWIIVLVVVNAVIGLLLTLLARDLLVLRRHWREHPRDERDPFEGGFTGYVLSNDDDADRPIRRRVIRLSAGVVLAMFLAQFALVRLFADG